MTDPKPQPPEERPRKPKRLAIGKGLDRLQDLIGSAQSIYQNDRSNMRADHLLPVLAEAFAICVELRSRRKAT